MEGHNVPNLFSSYVINLINFKRHNYIVYLKYQNIYLCLLNIYGHCYNIKTNFIMDKHYSQINNESYMRSNSGN